MGPSGPKQRLRANPGIGVTPPVPVSGFVPVPVPVPSPSEQQQLVSVGGGVGAGVAVRVPVVSVYSSPSSNAAWPNSCLAMNGDWPTPVLTEKVRRPERRAAWPAQSRNTPSVEPVTPPSMPRVSVALRCRTPTTSMLESAWGKPTSNGHGFWPHRVFSPE